MKQKQISGERIILRERRKTDAAYFAYWYNQPNVMFQCGFTEPTSEENEVQIIENEAADSDWYTITNRDGTIIGETGLLRMWPVWHCTDLSIIIPDPAMQRKGYGTEAIRLMIDLAFRQYAMNRIAIGVVAKNVDAVSFYRKIGFRQEGIQEQGYFYDNEYSDFIMMRLLRQEWAAMNAGQA